MKDFLDSYVAEFKTLAFVKSDPMEFAYGFQDDAKACEFVAFFSALLSYGRREKIRETLAGLLSKMDNDPVGFLNSFDSKKDKALFKHFVYRFNTGEDLIHLFSRLQWAYQEYGSLEQLFSQEKSVELQTKIASFVDQLSPVDSHHSYGMKFLLAHPSRGGACKRFNMFLRWMVRQDDVDLGLWKTALTPADLLIPLDTHVARLSKDLKLSTRNANDWQKAEEITSVFRQYCPEDPIKYDFALMGLGLQGWKPEPTQTKALKKRKG